jgi:hypothetical protein
MRLYHKFNSKGLTFDKLCAFLVNLCGTDSYDYTTKTTKERQKAAENF